MVREGKNAFEIFLNLLSTIEFELPPLKILVGCTKDNPRDYSRFKNSEEYTLYIDKLEAEQINTPAEAEKQYNMYTINYDDLEKNYLKLNAESVELIHFDKEVSYFAPLKYLEIAQHLLIPNGKIIWDLANHQIKTYFYRDNNFIDFYKNQFNKTQLERMYNVSINIQEEKITPNGDNFFDKNILSPQIGISIFNRNSNNSKRFSIEPYYDNFINYCSRKYHRLRFEKKTFSFQDYTYPVPIRIINEQFEFLTYNPIVDFVLNTMDINGRERYFNMKYISDEEIINLATNVYDNHKDNFEPIIPHETRELYNSPELINIPEYQRDVIVGLIHTNFIKQYEYIEATKK